jgi:hypothetical protein
LFETGSHYVTQADLELALQSLSGLDLKILLPQPPKCWDDRLAPPDLVDLVTVRIRNSVCADIACLQLLIISVDNLCVISALIIDATISNITFN